MQIEYRTGNQLDAQAVADLYRAAGLRRDVDNVDRIRRMVEHANLVITAWDGDRLVGVARSFSDFSYITYLSDLAVHREYQRQGIGKELIRRTKEAGGEECSLLLLSAPEAMKYYPHVGFEPVPNGFVIKRTR